MRRKDDPFKVINGHKLCQHCFITKPVSDYEKKGICKSGIIYRAWCKVCYRKKSVQKSLKSQQKKKGHVLECRTCHEIKTYSEFYPSIVRISVPTAPYCKECHKGIMNKIRHKDWDTVLTQVRASLKRNKESAQRALKRTSRKHIALVSDTYVKTKLIIAYKKQGIDVNHSDITADIIQLYRKKIKILRKVRQHKQLIINQ